MNETFRRRLFAIYRLLLRLYPERFREEFAEEMGQVFADALAGAQGASVRGVALLCWRELRDLPLGLLRQHWRGYREDTVMTGLKRPEWHFYLSWLAVTATAYPLGWGLTSLLAAAGEMVLGPDMVLAGVRRITFDVLQGSLLLPVVGLTVGALQYVVLRRYLPRMRPWVVLTAAGWLLAAALDALLPRSTAPFLWLGLAMALPQWLLLRRRVPHAAGWPLLNAGIWLAQIPLLFLGLYTSGLTELLALNTLWLLTFVPGCAGALVLGLLIAQAEQVTVA